MNGRLTLAAWYFIRTAHNALVPETGAVLGAPNENAQSKIGQYASYWFGSESSFLYAAGASFPTHCIIRQLARRQGGLKSMDTPLTHWGQKSGQFLLLLSRDAIIDARAFCDKWHKTEPGNQCCWRNTVPRKHLLAAARMLRT